MFALLFGLMYLLFIRPQSKRRREAEQMQRALGAGSKVITIGGLYGTIVDSDDESVMLEIQPGVTARYARQAIARVQSAEPAPEAAATEATEDEPAAPSAVEETKKSN